MAHVPIALFVLPNFHSCFYDSIETQKMFSLFFVVLSAFKNSVHLIYAFCSVCRCFCAKKEQYLFSLNSKLLELQLKLLLNEVTNKNIIFAHTEREERRREKTKKKEILWESKMDETSEETRLFTESTWLPPNQANVSFLQLNIVYHFHNDFNGLH